MRAAICSLAVISVATFAAALPCAAQVRVEVTPFVGAYLLRTDFASGAGDTCLDGFLGGRRCGGWVVRQRNAPIRGGQITGWLGKRLAVDLSVGYSPSGMVSQPGPALTVTQRSGAGAIRPLTF